MQGWRTQRMSMHETLPHAVAPVIVTCSTTASLVGDKVFVICKQHRGAQHDQLTHACFVAAPGAGGCHSP